MTGLVVYKHANNRYIRALILMLSFFVLAVCVCAPTFAGPQGGDVVGGLAQITRPDSVTTNITQATDKAIINWDGFNIDVNELVKFVQPGADSVALNRVTGADPSTILGQLLANGRVFLVNPNGVIFGPDSRVDVGSMIATTFDIQNDDFLSGNYDFLQKEGTDPSYIINQGQIKVADNGFVFLVAPGVKNEGLIIANIGKVVLGSGDKFTVDFRGDGLITYEISGKVVDTVKGPDGAPLTSAVSNTGTISSRGGEVVLTGDAAREVVSSVINQEGVIEAKSLVSEGGSVKLVGGAEGIVQNRGTIDVSADEAGAKSGEVSVSGDKVGNFGTILAQGAEEAKGGNVTLNSTTQTLNSTSGTIDVSGGVDSDGGSIYLLSDGNTNGNGRLFARGGEFGGDGGFIELSSLGGLSFTGQVDTWAPFGRTGTFLIDPKYVVIDYDSADPLTSVDEFTDAPESFARIGANTINAAMSNVTIQANTDIVAAADINIAAAGVGLTLQAGKRVFITKNITTNDGAVSITANDSGAGAANRDAGSGDIMMDYGTTIDAGNAPINLTVDGMGGEPGTINVQNLVGSDVIVSSAGDLHVYGSVTAQDLVSLESTSGSSEFTGGSITATNLHVKAPAGFGPMLTAVDNLAVDGGTGDVYISNSKALNFTTIGSTTGVSTSGNIYLFAPTINLKANDLTQTGAGGIFLGSNVVLADDVNLSTNNGVIRIGGTINSDAIPRSFTLNSSGGDVTVSSAIGAVSPLSSLSVTGSNIEFNDIGGASAGVTGATSITGAPTGSISFTGTTCNAQQQTYNAGTITLGGVGNKTFTSVNSPVSFMGTVDLNGRDLTATTGSGAVTFNGMVYGYGNLVVNTTGDTIFNGEIGNSGFLNSITTDAGGRTIINGGYIQTFGAQIFNDSVTLGSLNTQFYSREGGDITFNGTLDGASQLVVYNQGTTTFGGAVGDKTPLTSIINDEGGALTINGGSVTTTGTQTYWDDVTLGAPATTFTSVGDGDIFFVNALNGASDLTVNTDGVIAFYGAVGDVSALASITASSNRWIQVRASEINTTGAQTYNSSVIFLTPANTFTSTGDADITFNKNVAGNSNLTLNTAGTTTFGGNVDRLASLTTDAGGTTVINGDYVITLGSQTYGDSITLTAPATTFTSTDDANIVFNNRVAGASDMTVNTAGTTTFNDSVDHLNSLTTDTGGGTLIDSELVATSGAQIYGDDVFLSANRTTIESSLGDDITFHGKVNGFGDLAVNTTGDTAFNGEIGSLTYLNSIATDAGGRTIINGGLVKTATDQTYLDNVILGTPATTFDFGVGGDLLFNGLLDGASDLVVNSFWTTTFNGAVGGRIALTSITKNFNGTTAINGGSVTTTGSQFYYGSVALDAPATAFTSTGAADITFNSIVTGTSDMTVNTAGTTTFGDNVDGLTSLTTDAGGTTVIDGELVATQGAQTYGDSITLTAPATTFTSTGAADITFNNGVSGSWNSMTVNTAGTTAFNDSVNHLNSLTTDAGGTTAINGNYVITYGAQTYGDDVILDAAAVSIYSPGDGNITFSGKLDGASELVVSTDGVTTFNGAVGSTTPLTGLAKSYRGLTAINGGSVTTIDGQMYGGSVILSAPATTFTSTGDMWFIDRIDGASDFTVNMADTVSIFGPVGEISPLTSFTMNGGGTAYIKGGGVTTTGTQTYNALVSLPDFPTTFTSTGAADITFNNKVTGYSDLTVNTAGTTTFGDDLEYLASLRTDAGGTTIINSNWISTYNAQTYGDDVILSAERTYIESSRDGDITFNGKVDGASELVISTNGTMTFNGAVGGTTPVTIIDVTAGSDVNMTVNATTSISVNTSSANGDIRLTSSTGDIPLGVINAGTGLVSLTAMEAITDANGTANNIFSSNIALMATTGIGSVADPIESQGITTLAASTATGDICLTNTGALTVGTVDGLTGVGITSSEAAGAIALTANSPLIIDARVMNAGSGDIMLSAGASSGDDDITADAPITANGGNVTLIAADAVDQNENISTSGTGDVAVTAGTGSITMGSGASTTVANGNATYSAQDNISVNEIITATIGPGGRVTLTTLDGDVIDLNGAAPNISANNVAVTSAVDNVFLQDLIDTRFLPDMVILNNSILFGTMMDELLRATSPLKLYVSGSYNGYLDGLVEDLLITPNTGSSLIE